MPKHLLNRWQPESIREFTTSARRRFDDGLALALSGREFRTGAIYLFGYCAEMFLKAAYFRLIGLAETDAITWASEISPAIARGRILGITWPSKSQGHNVPAWAELLVAERATMPGGAYAGSFGFHVLAHGQCIGELWNESLRYHKNIAYRYELRKIRESAEWFLIHSKEL